MEPSSSYRLQFVRVAYLPLAYLLVVLVVNVLFDTVTLEHPRDSIMARDAAAALTLPFLTMLLWWGRRVSMLSAASSLAHIVSHRRQREALRLSGVLLGTLVVSLRRRQHIPILASLFLFAGYVYAEDLYRGFESLAILNKFGRLALLLQGWGLWYCLLNFVTSLVIQFLMIKQYLNRYLRVRLFEIEELSPACNIVIVNFCIAVFALCCYPLHAIFIDIPDTDQYVLLVLSVIIAVLLLAPVFFIRNIVARHKALTLERINAALSEHTLHNSSAVSNRRLVDNEGRLQVIADLLVVRKEIDNAPLWPMNMPFAFKMVILLSLPMLSWMGAGIVSQLLKLIHGGGV